MTDDIIDQAERIMAQRAPVGGFLRPWADALLTERRAREEAEREREEVRGRFGSWSASLTAKIVEAEAERDTVVRVLAEVTAERDRLRAERDSALRAKVEGEATATARGQATKSPSPAPERCPSCESDNRAVRLPKSVSLGDSSSYAGCADAWHCCPTCGSDDPKWCGNDRDGGSDHPWSAESRFCCSDAFHSQPSEGG